MPNIRQYENKVNLTPDDRASRAQAYAANTIRATLSEAGREIGSGIATLGETYVKMRATQEISQGLATAAEIQDNTTTSWDVTLKNADPNDPAVADRWRNEQLDPILNAWVSTFTTEPGKKWAEQHAASLRQHFFEKSAADQAALAGAAAVQNLQSLTNGLSNSVLQDPTSLNLALGTTDSALEAILGANPNINATTSTKVRSELREQIRKTLTQSAFIGMARANPEAAMQALQDGFGGQDLDATERNRLFGFAEDIKRQRASDDRAALAAQRQAQKDDFNAKVSALSGQMFAADGSIQVPDGFHQQLVMLSTHPGADDGAIRALGDAAARATKDALDGTYQRTDNSVWQGLASRIGRPAGDPQALSQAEVDRAYAAGKLSNADYTFLRRAADSGADPVQTQAQKRVTDALSRVRPLVDKSNLYSGKLDQSGIALYDSFYYDVFQRYNLLVSQGKTPTEAADILTDPRNPGGIQAMLPAYQTTNKQGLSVIQERTRSGGGPTPIPKPPAAANARKPGETPEEYLKRIGQ